MLILTYTPNKELTNNYYAHIKERTMIKFTNISRNFQVITLYMYIKIYSAYNITLKFQQFR
jgi:hypothetical protein